MQLGDQNVNNHKQNFQDFSQNQLNTEQRKAIESNKGSYLIIAGAGSGKTRVITARITNLILEHDVEPSSIVALTFTNKAAQEMRERIEQFLPELPTKPIIATFHSYCLRLLKSHQHLLGVDSFSVIDAQDQYKLVQNLVKDHGVNNIFNAKQLLSAFSSFKMADLLKLESDSAVPAHHLQQFMELFNAYEQQKRASNYLDFDDLLYKTFTLFKTNPEFKNLHQLRHRHILVDEYQDTNLIQHELLKQMTLHDNEITVDSICAVGDEDQSIYSWRGATVENILDFDKEFSKTKIIKLEQNYRSTQRILDIANHVISNNSQRNHKKLWSANTAVHAPLKLECLSDLQEAYTVTNMIKRMALSSKLSSIALLYRTHYQSRIIEEALIKESIPYKIIGGLQFYDRKEIKDLVAYLRLVINPFDKMSFLRVVNCPLRGLGKKFEELFLDQWNQQPFLNFIQICEQLIEQKLIAPRQITSLKSFIKLYKVLSEETLPAQALEIILKNTGYINYLADNFDKQEAQTKRENVAELIRAAEYVQKYKHATLSDFLDDIALMQEHVKKDAGQTDCVKLMTLHSAKGLEFPTVILSGLEDGVLPSNQSVENGNVEEERRLFYVGITRAKHRLILLHSKHRNTFGQMTLQRPSRFLQEIPQHLIIEQNVAHWSKSQFATFFTQWLTNKATSNPTSPFSAPPQSSGWSRPVVPKSQPKKINKELKRLQTVKHPTFGIGIAHQFDKKGDKTIVTVHFSSHGKKKIDSSFLEII